MSRAFAAPAPPEAPAPASASTHPLTEAQAGLWYAQQLDPTNPVFNTAHALEMRGVLDVEAFRRAVDTAAGEADALSIRVGHDATTGTPLQWVAPEMRPSLIVVDLSDHADPAAEAESRIHADLASPVDPARDPIVAERLFLLGERRYVWYQRVHHIAIDAYGTSLLMRRVCDLYTAAVEGAEPPPTPFAPYEALLAWEAEYLGSERRQRDRRQRGREVVRTPRLHQHEGAVLGPEVDQAVAEKEAGLGGETMRMLEKHIMLSVLDDNWKQHLARMDYLRQGIHLRGYAQKQPKQEYKKEAFELFAELLDDLHLEFTRVPPIAVRPHEEAVELVQAIGLEPPLSS